MKLISKCPILHSYAEDNCAVSFGHQMSFLFSESSMKRDEESGRFPRVHIHETCASVLGVRGEPIGGIARNKFNPRISNDTISWHSSRVGNLHFCKYPFAEASLVEEVVRELRNAKSGAESFLLKGKLLPRICSRLSGFITLPSNYEAGSEQCPSADPFRPRYEYVPPWHILLGVLAFLGAGIILFSGPKRDFGDLFLAYSLVFCGGTMVLVGHRYYYADDGGYTEGNSYGNRNLLQHNGEIVPQKHLDRLVFLGYSNYMANVLNTDKQIAVIEQLAEGSSIRSIERITGIHRDTIMRLGVKIGQGCTAMMDATMRDLPCTRLELDEIWGFVGKKARSVQRGDSKEVGDVWTWCAIDAETKLVPTFMVADRSQAAADAFVAYVASRMAYRVQISTDGFYAYTDAMQKSFGGDVDYGKIIKVYGTHEFGERRYSTSGVLSSEKIIQTGRPNVVLISTSYAERLNATTRLHMRRLTRLTLAFSKKRENFAAAVGLHFAYYNFVKRHNTLRCTPAMAAGVATSQLSIGELIEAAA